MKEWDGMGWDGMEWDGMWEYAEFKALSKGGEG